MKIIIAVVILSVYSSISFSQNIWEQIGPTGGDIQRIYTASNGDIYVAASGSGLYKSMDNGTTWKNLTDTYSPQAMCVSQMGNIYISAQLDGNWSPTGLLRTNDNGLHWEIINQETFNLVYCLYAEEDGNILVGNYHTLIRLNESTLKTDTLMIANEGIYSIFKYKQIIFLGCEDGCYKSTDDGKTWKLNNSISRGFGTTKTNFMISKTSTLYFSGSGVFSSADLGETWTDLCPGFTRDDIIIDSKDNLYAIDFSGSSGYVARIQKRVGNNLPAVWQDLSSEGLPLEAVWCLGMDKNDVLIAGLAYSGIYKFDSSSNSWKESNNGLYGRDIWPLFFTPKGTLLAAEYPNHDLYRSVDKGLTWDRVKINDQYNYALDFASNSKGEIFISTSPGGLYKSTDDGITWNGPLFTNSAGFTAPIGINSKDHIFYGGSWNLMTSTDEGINWKSVYGGNWLNDLFIDSNDNIYICFSSNFTSGAFNPGIMKSEDGGNTWIVTNEGLLTKNVSYIIGDRNSNLFAFDYSSVDEVRGIFKSTDGGYTWQQVASKYILRGFAIDSKGIVFAATAKSSVIYSDDQGNTWKSIPTGKSKEPWFYSIAVNNEDYIYAGTVDNSILRIKFIPTSIAEDAKKLHATYFLSQNYPNPYNPETTIKYQIPESGHVTLKVYDLLGREVATLINEFKQAGTYNAELNISNYSLSSGVYFYRLQAGGFAETKKMILMK
jgi:photosystem II stability/assembly factor-like uncharacterized protein